MDICDYNSCIYHIILYYLYRLGFVPHLEVTQVVQSYHYQQVSQSRCSPCPYSREEPPPRVHYTTIKTEDEESDKYTDEFTDKGVIFFGTEHVSCQAVELLMLETQTWPPLIRK